MKKILAILMAVLMLALPLSGMADAAHTTVTLKSGSIAELAALTGADETMTTMVKDMIDCLSFDVYKQDSQAGATLYMSGNTAVTADVAWTADGGVTLASSLLGDDVIVCSMEECTAYAQSLLGEEAYAQIMEQLSALMAGAAQTEEATEAESSVLGQIASEMSLTETLAVVNDVYGRMVFTEVTETPDYCDPAATRMDVNADRQRHRRAV